MHQNKNFHILKKTYASVSKSLLIGLLILSFSSSTHARRRQAQSIKNPLVSIESKINAQQVQVGDSFQLDVIVTIRSNASLEELILPDLSAFRVLDDKRSRSQRIFSINGKRTEEYIRRYTYILRAERIGKHKIGFARARVGKHVAKSNALNVLVKKARTQKRNNDRTQQDYFLKVSFDKKQAYVGEQVTLLVEVFASSSIDIRPLTVPKLPGFWTEEMGSRQVRATERRIGNRAYYVYPIQKLAVFPLDTGIHDTGTISVQITTGGGLWSRGKKQVLNAPAQELVVLPLPSPEETGDPPDIDDDFEGNVGFYRLRAQLSSPHTTVGQAVSLKITLSGEGNPGQARLPDVESILKKVPNLRVFPPSFTEHKSIERGRLYGEKSVELLVQPLKAGRITLPSFSTSFFNPQRKKYELANSRPLLLKVGAAQKKEFTAENNPQQRQNEISGVRPLATRVSLTGKPKQLWTQLLSTAPPLILISIFMHLFLRRQKSKKDSAIGKLESSRKDFFKKIAQAESEQKLQEVQELLLQMLFQHVHNDVRAASLPQLEELLVKEGINISLSREICSWFEQVDSIRYAGELGDRRALFSSGKILFTKLFDHIARGLK